MFKIINQHDCGVLEINIPNHKDDRGIFNKAYNYNSFIDLGINFIPREHFHSISDKNVLRGMHFQTKRSAHNKLINCVKGSILDVCVDVRKGSKYYNQPVEININEDSNIVLFIPKGFAHGFLSYEDNTIVQYMTDTVHDPINDRGILWNSIDFNWPIESPILSDRDKTHTPLGYELCEFY